MEITHLGSGICSQSRRITGAIFCETRPAMIIRSAWRGEGRNTSAPKRAMSKRDAPMAIISMAQQAKPKVMGQMELLRHQFTAQSSEVKMIPSGGCSPKATSRILVISCSLPTVFSKRSSPFMLLLYSERRGRFQFETQPLCTLHNSSKEFIVIFSGQFFGSGDAKIRVRKDIRRSL